MTAHTLSEPANANAGELQLATFYVGGVLLGLEIDQVQEINRRLDVTVAPQSPSHICGVINLRGDVVTVIDLRTLLGFPKTENSALSRNLIVSHNDELIGLCVDQIADILTVSTDSIDQLPPNVDAIDSQLLSGVYPLDDDIVVVLDLESALDGEP